MELLLCWVNAQRSKNSAAPSVSLAGLGLCQVCALELLLTFHLYNFKCTLGGSHDELNGNSMRS